MKNPPLEPITVTTNGAARLLGVSRSRFYDWKKAGLISVYRYNGNRPLYLRADVVALLDALPRGPKSVGPLLPAADRKLARRRSRNLDTGPTEPLLPIEQQQIVIERASEPPPPIEQQQPAVEPESLAPSACDLAAVHAECLRLLAPNGEEEGRLRALERTVRAISRDRNCSIDEAKRLVLAAIAKAKEPA